MKNIIIVLLVVFLLGSVVWQMTDYVNENTNQLPENTQVDSPSEDVVRDAREQLPDVVATVNGIDITKEEFLRTGEQVARDATVQGFDISTGQAQTEISQIALSNIIDQLLLLDLAEKANVVASGTWVDAQYASLIERAGGQESFENQLQEGNIDPNVVRNDFATQSIIDQFLEQELELSSIEITDEQVGAYYDELLSQNGTSTPALDDELSGQINQQLVNQERQRLIGEYLTTIRANAEIEVKI